MDAHFDFTFSYLFPCLFDHIMADLEPSVIETVTNHRKRLRDGVFRGDHTVTMKLLKGPSQATVGQAGVMLLSAFILSFVLLSCLATQ